MTNMKTQLLSESKKMEFNDLAPIHRTPSNFKLSGIDMEWNEEPSLTIPDESFSVKEILERFTTGMPLAIQKQPIYDSEAGFDDIDETRDPAFDLADATEAKINLENEINTKKEAAKAAKVAKEADDKRSAEEASKAANAANGSVS